MIPQSVPFTRTLANQQNM